MPSDGSFSIPFICHGQVLVELIEKNKLKKFLKKNLTF